MVACSAANRSNTAAWAAAGMVSQRSAEIGGGTDMMAEIDATVHATSGTTVNSCGEPLLLATQTFGGLRQRGDGPWQGSPACGPDGCVLGLEQFLCLGRPRHQFAVETDPLRIQFTPQ